MLAFSNDYYGMIFRATQSVELFCAYGAKANALYLTIVEMAKTYNLNLYDYLKFLFEHRPNKGMSDEEFENLAPWNEHV